VPVAALTLLCVCVAGVGLMLGGDRLPGQPDQGLTAQPPHTRLADTEWRFAAKIPEPISAVAGDGAAIAANTAAAGIRVQEGETLLGTRGPQLVLGDLDLHGVEVVIPAGALPDATEVTLQTPERVPRVVSGEFAPVGAPIAISAGDAPVRLDEPVTISFRLDAEALAGVEDPRTFWAAYFDGERWQYLWADEVDLEAGVLHFTTYHFSSFGIGRLSLEKRIEQYTHNAALAAYTQEQMDERLSEAAGDLVKHVLTENLGIDDEALKAKVITSMVTDPEWGSLAENALLDRDMARLNQDLQVLIGKAIVMAVPETVLSKSLEHLVSDVGVGTATAAAQAVGHLAEGRSRDAARIIGEHIADQFAITIAGRIAVDAVQHQIDSWRNSEVEAAYQAFKNGANSWGYSVDAGDFDAVWRQMRGVARQLQIEAIRQQNESRRDAGFDPLSPEEENALRERVRRDLRRQFERRKAEEEAVEQHRREIMAMIDLYQKDGLLTEGRHGWTAGYGLEERLDELLHLKRKIMRDVNATAVVDGYMLHDGQLGRGAIIRATMAWYAGGQEAYARYLHEAFGISLSPEVATPTPTPSRAAATPTPSGRAGWYLVEVKRHDFGDAGLRQGVADGRVVYEFVGAEGGKGNLTITHWEAFGPTRDSELISECVYQVRWDDPPAYLEPGQKVSFRFTQSATERCVLWMSSWVSFDAHDLPGPNNYTDAAIYFVTPDGDSTVHYNFAGVLQSQQVIPRGRPGDRRAIWLTLPELYGFSYHYEWRE
jgi:hypothetical protein